MRTYFLAVDPGVHMLGVAVVNSDGTLERAGYIQPKELDHWVRGLPKLELTVIEKPQIYQAPHQKGDQNDLIDLAVTVGRIAREIEWRCSRVELVTPRQWKGQIPKEVTKARVLAALSEPELDRIEWPKAKAKHHNIFDAIHLALKHFTTRKV